jgi:hypothetical protein
MTILKRLGGLIYDALVHGIAMTAPFLGVPAVYRAFSMRRALTYRGGSPR